MNEYYSGMFSSLKHNILLMLSQIEGNLEFADEQTVRVIKNDLCFVKKRIDDIIKESNSLAKGESSDNTKCLFWKGRCNSDYGINKNLECDGINPPKDCPYPKNCKEESEDGTWVCKCGYINYNENKVCHRCGVSQSEGVTEEGK